MRAILKLITAGLLLWAPPGESRDLTSSDVNGGEYPAVEAVAYFGKLIAEKTSGRLVLAVPGVGSKASETFSIAAVRSGTQDMARVNITAFDTLLPEATVMALPYLFRSTPHLRHVIDGPIGEARNILAQRDIHLVVVCPAMSELSGGVERTADSFAALYAEKALPDWLVNETPPGSVLEIYAVKAP